MLLIATLLLAGLFTLMTLNQVKERAITGNDAA